MRKFAIVAIVKDEAPYLIEWLAFHRAIGVRDFFIYNNESADETYKITRMHRHLGVTVKWWPRVADQSPQITAYEDFIEHHSSDYRFVAFIDLDEFIMPQVGLELNDWLETIPDDAGSIVLNQRVFGSSNQTAYNQDLVLRRFSRCSTSAYSENRYVKPIYRSEALAGMQDIHMGEMKHGRRLLSDFREARINQLEPCSVTDVCHAPLQLNHYILKSMEEYQAKKLRGNAHAASEAFRFTRYTEEFFHGRDGAINDEFCERTHKWIVPTLKEMLCFFEFARHKYKSTELIEKYYSNTSEFSDSRGTSPRAYFRWKLKSIYGRRLRGAIQRRRLPG